ncbi:MAG: hypothetical protein JNK48_04815 [Bryobacterales bacterium]|nr:hypothetical protein [Bryobacterales bacterium]
MNWTKIAELAREAFREGVNAWIGKAGIAGGVVNGPVLELRPGALNSPIQVNNLVFAAMTRNGVSPLISKALANTLGGAWHEWAAGFHLRATAFPALAAVPAPAAGPTPGVPVPLRQGASSGESSLSRTMLSSRLAAALQGQTQGVTGNMPQSMDDLAQWVDGSYQDWKSLAMLSGLAGQGNVPTFAPPYVPVGPVIQGNVMAGGTVFAGPRFGRIVPPTR